MHFQRLPVKAFAIANRTGHEQIGQKVHFDFLDALPLAFLAPPALHVKAESPAFETALLGLARAGEHLANFVEHADVRGGVTTGRSTDCRLIDRNNLVDLIHASQARVWTRLRT